MVEEFIDYLNADFTRLEKQEFSFYLWLKNDDLFNGLRGDPRFADIMERHRQLYELNRIKYPDINLTTIDPNRE